MSQTQIEAARAGAVTPEMESVARAEYLELIGGQRRLQELERIENLQPTEGG